MLVGLDFDNTIVCYDRLFHRLAVERGLVPPSLLATKQSVRNHLRASGREDDWTELQGIAYGPRITDAEPFAGAKECLARLRVAGVEVAVVSHKTRHPFRGARHDLHAAAHAFLEVHGFYATSVTGLSPESVFLELTIPAKLTRIGSLRCDAFVDDLPELLSEAAFPAGVNKILFDPGETHDTSDFTRVTSWEQIGELLTTEGSVFA